MTGHFISGNIVACDTETTGLNVWKGDAPFAFSFCNEAGEIKYFEWLVDPFTRKPRIQAEELDLLKMFFSDPTITKVFHNSKFDIRMLSLRLGIVVADPIHDTMIAARVCNSSEESLKLKPLAAKHCGIPEDDERALKLAVCRVRREALALGWNLAPGIEADYWTLRAHNPESDLCRKYAEGDAIRTMRLWQRYTGILESDIHLQSVYLSEMKLLPVVYHMENRGVRIDREAVDAQIEKCRESQQEVLQSLHGIAGDNFNPNSAAQIGNFIVCQLGLKVQGRTPSGQPATDRDTLQKYDHPFTNTLLQYRAASKALEMFEGYREAAVRNRQLGCYLIHPNLNQVGAKTGRFSCSNPNLQNVGNRHIAEARSVFGPRPGYTWYLFDYKQVEACIFADVAGETNMLEAIRTGRDLHSECANRIWGGKDNPAALQAVRTALSGTEYERVEPVAWLEEHGWDIVEAEAAVGKKTSRSRAKAVFFAKIYGGGTNAVMENAGCTESEARKLLGDYDKAFPIIVQYSTQLASRALREGGIVTRYGRRIEVERDKSYRAVNYIVQGSAADMMKRTMVRVDAYIRDTGLDAHLVMTIHDELVVEVRKEHAFPPFLRGIKRVMEDNEGHFGLGMTVEVSKVDTSWSDKEAVDLG